MDIEYSLLHIQGKHDVDTIAKYACKSNANFKLLMKYFTGQNSKLAEKAAWCVSNAVEQQPAIIKPYIETLVDQLCRNDVHNAIIRNSVRVLQNIEIPENLHGKVMNACFNFIENINTASAIKAFSLTALFNLSKIYPEIKHELKLIIEERWDTETPAFKSRGRKILKLL